MSTKRVREKERERERTGTKGSMRAILKREEKEVSA
jgi:hypothetical protein